MAKDKSKKYWKGIEELENRPEFRKSLESEFPEGASLSDFLKQMSEGNSNFSRRSFLKATGFSISAAIVTACARGPVEKAIPLLNRAEIGVPGKAYWYTSICQGCSAGCGILVKNRDGRPIKIEGNPRHPLSQGGVCAVGQAMVLGLYDSKRLQQPMINGQAINWQTIDKKIIDHLNQTDANVYLLTETITSPTTRHLIQQFLKRFKNSDHIEYDPVSYSAIMAAHQQTHRLRVLPHYRFDRAQVIVSFDADFLGTWLSPVEFTKDYIKNRELNEPEPQMSYHVQFEGRMSVTGANADDRIVALTGEFPSLLNYMALKLAEKAGITNLPFEAKAGPSRIKKETLDEIVSKLWNARSKSLVICGTNDLSLQIVTNFINHLLGNYGTTIDLSLPSEQKRGDENKVRDLVEKMNRGKVNALFIAGVNPVYSLPNGEEFQKALASVPLTVALTEYLDETAGSVDIVGSRNHFLESWNDSEPVKGCLGIAQPLISRLGSTRTLSECLSAWMGNVASDYELIQDFWQKNIFPLQREHADFESLWDRALLDGYVPIKRQRKNASSFKLNIVQNFPSPLALSKDFELVLYLKVGLLDGRHAQNPWLQELPDPVTKAVWDNYACLAPQTAKKLNLRQGDVIQIVSEDQKVELPVLLQPGQHEKVIAVALGYGRNTTQRFRDIGPNWILKRRTVEKGETVGENAYRFLSWRGRFLQFANQATIHSADRKKIIAQTQTYYSITVPKKMGGETRPLIRETTLKEYLKNPASGNERKHQIPQLWPNDHVYTGHHWAMVIDLSKCTGCSACVISCQAENNIPVVGKDEVYRRRELHWIRIDRYYSGTKAAVEVVHQPVMCHHCDHAPCEGVCPVLATVHSDEGINQQIYNRCVGTRYCANNCPYKVRRFNWFNYRTKDEKENLVLNPDVTTRSRGVMEKCSLCVQRIQEAKAEAKRDGVKLADGDIKLACEQSCPAGAIVFGDMNDPESRVSKLIDHPRHYRMLEEMNFKPTVGYLTLVRNKT